MPEIHVEVCANCHPFYTGGAKYIDTMGQVQKFQARQSAAKPTARREKVEKTEAEEESPKSLKEVLAKLKTQSKE